MKISALVVLAASESVNSFHVGGEFQLSHRGSGKSVAIIRKDSTVIFAKVPGVVKFIPDGATEATTEQDNINDAYAEADSIFDTIDINKDGGISNAELRAHLVVLGYSQDSIRYLFTALDANADGVISRKEMRYAFSNYESTALYMALGLGNDVTDDAFNDAIDHVRTSAVAGSTSTEANNELADLIFDMIDVDRSGKIDPEELQEHLRLKGNSTWEIGNFSANSVESVLEALDIDFDGTISRDEMREGFNQYDPRALAKALGLRVSRTAEI